VNESEIEPIDVVYTWVDDSFPGYLDSRDRYAQSGHDRNPNRTRDNVDVLKYSLRSLQRFVPWVRNVYLFSCRPQVPAWLDPTAPGLHVIHHDEVFDPVFLPTFNSFAIVSYLHRLPGLSSRFIYIEDDMLFGAPVTVADFIGDDGRVLFYPHLGYATGAAHRDEPDPSPWSAAQAWCSHLLDERYGEQRRRSVNHLPLLMDREVLAEMEMRWPEDYLRTRTARFRAPHQAVPEYLYPWVMVNEGRGRLVSLATSYRRTLYHPMENILPWAWYGTLNIRLRRPRFFTLNDNFDDSPHPGVVRWMRGFLERFYPEKSRFER